MNLNSQLPLASRAVPPFCRDQRHGDLCRAELLKLGLKWDVPGHQLAPETLLFGGENRLQSRDRVKKRKINKVSFSCSTTGGFELEAAPEGLWSNLLL